MTARRATVSAVAAVLAAALLVVVLVTWAASIGPSGVLRGDGIERAERTLTPAETSGSGAPRLSDGGRLESGEPDGAPGWVRTVAVVVEIATVCLVLFLLRRLSRWARETYGARRRRDPASEEVDFEVIDAPAALTREMLRDAGEQRRLVDAGEPGDAILACWHRFEVQASTAGLSRHPWETSSEFTLRTLELVAADGGAVARLAALYREARFSEHEMTEDDRRAAAEALDVIHRGLLQLSPGGRG